MKFIKETELKKLFLSYDRKYWIDILNKFTKEYKGYSTYYESFKDRFYDLSHPFNKLSYKKYLYITKESIDKNFKFPFNYNDILTHKKYGGIFIMSPNSLAIKDNSSIDDIFKYGNIVDAFGIVGDTYYCHDSLINGISLSSEDCIYSNFKKIDYKLSEDELLYYIYKLFHNQLRIKFEYDISNIIYEIPAKENYKKYFIPVED